MNSDRAKKEGIELGVPKPKDTRLFKKEYCRLSGFLGVIDENDFH